MNRIKTATAVKIHSRRVEIEIFSTENNKLIVVGVLQDQRRFKSHLMTGETQPPGILHHMIIRMVVAGPGLLIEDIEVEMPQTPRTECREVEACLQPVIGMPISAGFTHRVKEAVSGPTGCSHLVGLLLAMAPAAVQGYWSNVVRKPYNPADYAGQAMGFVLDTCHVWRSDGPVVKEYRKKFGLPKQS